MFANDAHRQARLAAFGKRTPFLHSEALAAPAPSDLLSDLKLFVMTFGGGLVFMTVYLA